MYGFWMVVGAVMELLGLGKPKKRQRVFKVWYGRFELVAGFVLFDCGCVFNLRSYHLPPKICQAHKLIMREGVVR